MHKKVVKIGQVVVGGALFERNLNFVTTKQFSVVRNNPFLSNTVKSYPLSRFISFSNQNAHCEVILFTSNPHFEINSSDATARFLKHIKNNKFRDFDQSGVDF